MKKVCQCSKCLGRHDRQYSKKTRNLHFRHFGMWVNDNSRTESQSLQMSPEANPDIHAQQEENNDMMEIGMRSYLLHSYFLVSYHFLPSFVCKIITY